MVRRFLLNPKPWLIKGLQFLIFPCRYFFFVYRNCFMININPHRVVVSAVTITGFYSLLFILLRIDKMENHRFNAINLPIWYLLYISNPVCFSFHPSTISLSGWVCCRLVLDVVVIYWTMYSSHYILWILYFHSY